MGDVLTKGNVIVNKIEIGDIHYEYDYGMEIKCEVITKPVQDGDAWDWESKCCDSGEIIKYRVTEQYAHYGPKLYDNQAYRGMKRINAKPKGEIKQNKMKGLEIYKGLETTLMSELKVEVTLTIDKVEIYPEDEGYHSYKVTFTNGAVKIISSLNDLEVTTGSMSTDLKRYEAVNGTKSLKELANVIVSFGDDDGLIMGREQQFDAVRMSEFCLGFEMHQPNCLTRKWGIRQQALMLSK